MDISKQFSLTDFLAYFFPGVFASVGMYLLILLTPAKVLVTMTAPDVTMSFVFLVLSYIIGVIFSGFSNGIAKWIEKVTHYKNPHSSLPPAMLTDDILMAFCDIVGVADEKDFVWTKNHFHLCRSIVIEKMPAIAPRISRHSDMALFRRNLVFPLLVWALVGISWGIWSVNNGIFIWGTALIILSLIVSFVTIKVTIQRMHNSKETETRETLMGFLAGCKTGVISKTNKSSIKG
jgi:hypothetical protein